MIQDIIIADYTLFAIVVRTGMRSSKIEQYWRFKDYWKCRLTL